MTGRGSGRDRREGGAPPPSSRLGTAYRFPDVLELLKTLVRHHVDFVVVGGVAVAQHGFSRTTRDLDVVPEPSPANIDRLWQALVELESRPAELSGLRASEHAVGFSRDSLADGGSWEVETKYGLLHVLQFLVGKVETVDDYARLRGQADAVRYEFGTVRFVGYSDLIDLKYIAGREQDMIDIRALEEARRTAGPEG
jgi:hypothetical protein